MLGVIRIIIGLGNVKPNDSLSEYVFGLLLSSCYVCVCALEFRCGMSVKKFLDTCMRAI